MSYVSSVLQKNILLQLLIILGFFILIRGNEGVGQPVSLDVNDTIVFSQILSNENLSESSLSVQYVRQSADVGFAILSASWLGSLGFSTETQFMILYVIQISILTFGVWFFLTSFRKEFGFIFLGVLLCYLSGFTGFGRYLALGAGFKIVSSGMALAVGFIVLGLHLRGKKYMAAILASLLALYHPSHGIVLLCILGFHALWFTFIRQEQSFTDLIKLGVVTITALLPFMVLVFPNVIHQNFNHEAWWSYVFSKTSNLTPLQDGLFVVIGIVSAIVCGVIAYNARRQDSSLSDSSKRALSILYASLILWAVQIFFTEVLPSITIAQLALTRVTPYAVITIVSVMAERAYAGFSSVDKKERLYGFLMIAGAVGAALPAWLPYLHIPTMVPPMIDIEFIFQANVREQAGIAILMAGLAWWIWVPYLPQESAVQWNKRMCVVIILFVAFFGLRAPSIAVLLMLVFSQKPQLIEKIPSSKAILCSMLAVICVFLFVARKPWARHADMDVKSLSELLIESVPEEGMVLTLPFRSLHGELTLPTRSIFMGYGESQYVLYAPSMIDDIWKRAELLGIKPINNDPTICSNWLLDPMCRRQYFEEKAKEKNTIWRSNLRKIREEAPELTHILMPNDMICDGDKVDVRLINLVLLPIDGVVEQDCLQEKDKNKAQVKHN